MKNLLWVGDAGVPTGFAVATHNILATLCQHYNVFVLGLNYRGDPHEHPYPIYSAAAGGDAFGIQRVLWMCDLVKEETGSFPDVIVLQNDPWNIPLYTSFIRANDPAMCKIPVVGAVAIDGKNCLDVLNELELAIFWTEFGRTEAVRGGCEISTAVIPLGVDLKTFYPVDKAGARSRRAPFLPEKTWLVGNVNRNQPRKRMDLTIKYFSSWIYNMMPVEERTVDNRAINDAWLYIHAAPTGDTTINFKELAKYYGILDRIAWMEPAAFYGLDDNEMRDTYNCFDVQITTTQGEGHGLTTFEGAACGVLQIVPDWAALGEYFKNAAYVIPCTSTHVGPPYKNVIGGIADEKLFVEALDRAYHYRHEMDGKGRERVSAPCFQWSHIGEAWLEELDKMFQRRSENTLWTQRETPDKVEVL